MRLPIEPYVVRRYIERTPYEMYCYDASTIDSLTGILDFLTRTIAMRRVKLAEFECYHPIYRRFLATKLYTLHHIGFDMITYDHVTVVHGYLHRPRILNRGESSLKTYWSNRVRFAFVITKFKWFVLYEKLRTIYRRPFTHMLLDMDVRTPGAEYAAVKAEIEQMPSAVLHQIAGLGPTIRTRAILADIYPEDDTDE